MNFVQVQRDLLDLVFLFRYLSGTNMQLLFGFVGAVYEQRYLDEVAMIIQNVNPEQLGRLIGVLIGNQDDGHDGPGDEKQLSKEQLDTFRAVFQLYLLEQMLVKSLSAQQLTSLFEIIPVGTVDEKWKTLQQLQQLLGDILPATLQSLQSLMLEQPEQFSKALTQYLRQEDFNLHNPFRMILQMKTDELLSLQEVLPKFNQIQVYLLVQLLRTDTFRALELRRLLSRDRDGLMPSLDVQTNFLAKSEPNQSISIQLQIVEQPPDKSIYKRNLTPNPTVLLVGDDTQVAGTLSVVPVLLRCDTQAELPKLMGNHPVVISAGRIVPFRKLKITATSHQEGGSLFCLRFELRRQIGNEFEILHSIQSNPILVLSHSSQMKTAQTSTVVVKEIIPFSGSTAGGTRVAILGANFVESPAARVRFDQTDVIPAFHGAGTLLCLTPQHGPGAVSVRASNDNQLWSETFATFMYQEIMHFHSPKVMMPSQYNMKIDIAKGIYDAAFQNGYDIVGTSPMEVDGGNGSFHTRFQLEFKSSVIQPKDGVQQSHYHFHQSQYEDQSQQSQQQSQPSPQQSQQQSQQSQHVCSLQSPSMLQSKTPQHQTEKSVKEEQDHLGNTALYYACLAAQLDKVVRFLNFGYDINRQNYEGRTPLYAAICAGCPNLCRLLLHHGAQPDIIALDGDSFLHSAVVSPQPSNVDREEIIDLLIKSGTHCNFQDDEGDTPLHWSVRERQKTCVSLLAKRGASVNSQNNDLETPLHLASSFGDLDIVETLIQFGANPNMTDCLNCTPLHEAVHNRHLEVVKTLLNHGAKLLPDIGGLTPLDWALEKGYNDLLPFLKAKIHEPHQLWARSLNSCSGEFIEPLASVNWALGNSQVKAQSTFKHCKGSLSCNQHNTALFASNVRPIEI